MPPRTLVIVPAWNEAGSVGDVVRAVRAAHPEFAVLVVDDGSTDRTAARAAEAGADVLVLPFNLGVGGAMRAGFLLAQREGYDRAVQVDADGQHDPAHLDDLLAALDHADIVIGARFASVGDYAVRGPRRWAMRLLAAVLSRVTGTRLTDATSGFRAANRDAIDHYVRYFPAAYLGDTVDSLVSAAHAGLRVAQVPVAMRVRAAGAPSQSTLRASLYLLRAVFVLLIAMLRSRRVVHRVAR